MSSENKGADQLRGYRQADLRLCFRIPYAKSRFSHNEAQMVSLIRLLLEKLSISCMILKSLKSVREQNLEKTNKSVLREDTYHPRGYPRLCIIFCL